MQSARRTVYEVIEPGIRNRPATVSAYEQAQPNSSQPAVTEEGKKLLFGQTAASIRALAKTEK